MLSDQCTYGCAVTTPLTCYGGIMKIKRVRLLADNDGIDDEMWRWDISLHIGRSGIIYNVGYIGARQNRAYYLRNQEKIKQRSRDWNRDNKEQKAETGAKWNANNQETCRRYAAEWTAANPDRRREIGLRWAKRNAKQQKARRRGMGFKPLNEKFDGAHAHHVDGAQVIYIPEELHRSVYHEMASGRGMHEINALAFQYLFKHT